MKTAVYVFVLACSVLLSGCGRTGQKPEDLAKETEPPPIIQIQNLTLTDATLTLDYQVSNPFSEDIWILLEKNRGGYPYAVTRIDSDWVWIKLRYYHEIEPSGVAERPGRGEYLRLAPGESYSGKILLDLPIRDGFRELGDGRKEIKEVVAHRVVFEVGYFGPRYSQMFKAIANKFGIKGDIDAAFRHPYLPGDVVVAEVTRDGQSCDITFIWQKWPFLRLEESAKDFITDVNIPCSVVMDDQ